MSDENIKIESSNASNPNTSTVNTKNTGIGKIIRQNYKKIIAVVLVGVIFFAAGFFTDRALMQHGGRNFYNRNGMQRNGRGSFNNNGNFNKNGNSNSNVDNNDQGSGQSQ